MSATAGLDYFDDILAVDRCKFQSTLAVLRELEYRVQACIVDFRRHSLAVSPSFHTSVSAR